MATLAASVPLLVFLSMLGFVVPNLLFTRGTLIALGRYGLNFFLICGLHFVSFFLSLRVYGFLLGTVPAALGFFMFVGFTNGAGSEMQLALLCVDLVQAYLLYSALETGRPVLRARFFEWPALTMTAVALVVCFFIGWHGQVSFGVRPVIEKTVDGYVTRMLSGSADDRRLMATFEQDFPDDYHALLRRYRERLIVHIWKPAIFWEKIRDVHRWFLADANDFVSQHAAAAAQGTDRDLNAIAHANLAAQASLRTIGYCGGLPAALVHRADFNKPSTAAMTQTSVQMAMTGLRAARDGIDHPANRETVFLLRPTRLGMVKALAARLPPSLLPVAVDLARYNAATDADRCSVNIATIQAVLDLPVPLGAQYMAYSMRTKWMAKYPGRPFSNDPFRASDARFLPTGHN